MIASFTHSDEFFRFLIALCCESAVLVVKWARIFDNAVSSGHKVGISRVLYECSMKFNFFFCSGS